MINHEAVFAIVDFKEGGPRKTVTVTVTHKSTYCEAQVPTRIGERCNSFAWIERFLPEWEVG